MKHEILDINSIIFQKIELMKIEHTTNSTEFISNLSSFYFLSEDLSLNIIILCQENVCFQRKTKDFLTVDRNARC